MADTFSTHTPFSEETKLALLGKHADLSWAELQAVCPSAQRLSPVFASLPLEVDYQKLQKRLGGVVKIYSLHSITSDDNVVGDLVSLISSKNLNAVAFSTPHEFFPIRDIAKYVKKEVTGQGNKFRFRFLETMYESAGIGTDWEEIALIKFDKILHILQAVSVQNIDYWSFKDYKRPGVDPRSGMMPPKVARMLVNLAYPQFQADPGIKIYDPFCGSGTLLVEALDLGYSVIGSDLSQEAVDDTQDNCAWFAQKTGSSGSWQVFQKDAVHVTLNDIGSQVDGIVFEGYLGPPNPRPEKFPNLIKGLGKLYKGVLKNLYPLLKTDGILVCALPEYHDPSGVKNLDHLIDDMKLLGYTRHNRFTYGRAHSPVKRSIYVLKKSSK